MAQGEQPSKYVTFVSSDGFEFHILRSVAYRAGTVKRMLDPKNGFRESITNTCKFEQINGVVLEKVCEYLYFNDRYHDMRDVPDMDFPPEISLELALAADFLNC